MLIRVHYSVNNHHVARSVLEEASLKMENKSVLKLILVMALPDRNYIRQTTVSRGNAVVQKSIPSTPFFRLFLTTHLSIDIIKCLQEMLVQSVHMEQSHGT